MNDLTIIQQAQSPAAPGEAFRYRPEADSFDLLGAWNILLLTLKLRWRMILASTVGAVALLMLYAFVWPPVFQATVAVAATGQGDSSRENFYDQWSVFRTNALQDEVVLFTSKPVLAEVVDDLELTYDDVYHPPLSYAIYLWSESWVGSTYQDAKKWLFGEKTNEFTPSEEEVDRAATIKDFQAGVAMAPVSDSNIGLINVRGPSPRVAEIANAVVDTYLRQRREVFAAEATEAYEALKGETDAAYAELTALEADMEQFFTENEMLLMFEKDKVEISQFLTVQEELSQSYRLIAKLEEQIAAIDVLLEGEEKEVVSSRTFNQDPVYASYEQQLGALQVVRSNLIDKYRLDSPEVQDVDTQIRILQSAMADRQREAVGSRAVVRNGRYEDLLTQRSTLAASLRGERAAQAVLAADVASRKTDVERIPNKMKLNHAIGREHSALERKYNLLHNKMMVAAVSAATAKSAPATIRVIEYAEVPFKPIAPNKKLLLVAGIVVGGGFGVGLALLLQYLHGGITRDSAAASSRGIRVFAMLPNLGGAAPRPLAP